MARMHRMTGATCRARRHLSSLSVVVLMVAALVPLAALTASPASAQIVPGLGGLLGSGQAVVSASANPSTLPAGGTSVLTANVNPQLLALLGNIPVTFQVVSGPNAGATVSCTVTYLVEVVGIPILGSNSCTANYPEPSTRSGVDTFAVFTPGQTPTASTSVTWLGVAGSLSLSPAFSFATVNSPATVTATVLDVVGAPVNGATVTFTATGTGGELPVSGSSLTDASGQAAFTFTSSMSGTSTVTASTQTPSGTPATATASVSWATGPARVTLTQENFNGLAEVGGTDTVSAAVLDAGGHPVGDGTPVNFTVTGAGATTGTTGTSGGNALFTFSSDVTGTSTITASAAGITSSPVTATWQAPVATTISLTPRISSQKTGTPQTLVAQVLDQFGNPLNNVLVRFLVEGANASSSTASGTTDNTGRLNFQETGSNPGRDTVVAWTDLNNNQLIDANEPYTIAYIFWSAQGYWLVASDGGIFGYGLNAQYHGSTGSIHLNKPIVGMASTPDAGGYWLVASDGGIFAFGDAGFFGSAGSIALNKPIVGMAATPDGGGYWLVASDGGIFNYGDAPFRGSAGGITLNKPIVGMAPTPSGGGYWLAASDGGIFNYGDAGFFGSAGSVNLAKPIVGIAANGDAGGYWLAASDGGVFNYGTANFLGSAGSVGLNQPVVAIAANPDGTGYYLAASDGGVFNFGPGAPNFGSAAGAPLNKPIVGMAIAP